LKIVAQFLCLILLSSCATLLNSPTEQITIDKNSFIKIDSLSEGKSLGNNKYLVKRDTTPLKVYLKIDTLQKIITLKPRNSIAYWSNIYFNAGICMPFEKSNQKRYGYIRKTYIDKKDTNLVITKYRPKNKGDIDFIIAIPYINEFTNNNPFGTDNNGGFLGLEVGFDYYYKKNRNFSILVGSALNFPAPIPAPVRYDSIHSHTTNLYLSLRNNYLNSFWGIGYGVHLSRNLWRKHNENDTAYFEQKYNSTSLGITINPYIKTSENFRLGLLYQPSLFQTSENINFNYQHLISFVMTWELKIKKNVE
jgi:hypothetical protein